MRAKIQVMRKNCGLITTLKETFKGLILNLCPRWCRTKLFFRKSMGLEEDEADINTLVQEHEEDLRTVKLKDLKAMKQTEVLQRGVGRAGEGEVCKGD